MVAASGHLAGGDTKAMINVEEYSVLDKIGARAGLALTFGEAVCDKVEKQSKPVPMSALPSSVRAPAFESQARMPELSGSKASPLNRPTVA